MKTYLNTLLLLAFTTVVCGAGYYFTEIQQPARLSHLQDVEEMSRLQHAQVIQLLAQAEKSSDMADASVRKWNSRYRFVPPELSTPDVVEYMEELTPKGFEAFDLRLEGVEQTPDVNFYTFSVDGTGYYSSLQNFIWQIENRPNFYRIRELSMARTTVYDQSRSSDKRGREMVQFSMLLDVYFGGLDGLSPERSELVDVPAEYQPSRDLYHNSFYPLIRERNRGSGGQDGLFDIRHASLVSIAGSRAIFQDGDSQFIVYEGSQVAYGTITRIDPINVFVRANLTIDGKSEVVDIEMKNERPVYRQAEGDVNLVPVETGRNN